MSEERSAYDKLTPQRKLLVDAILRNLKNGAIWKQGWINTGTPMSAITGKPYHGINNLFLILAASEMGYTDNRWATFNQMQDKGWKFKRDDEGKSLGKNAGVAIEFFELRDRETKKPFDRKTLDGMTKDERDEYLQKNIYPLRKYYRVFNGDVIEGIPRRVSAVADKGERIDRVDKLIDYWSDNESKIVYGGNEAFYRSSTDEIHLPQRDKFVSESEYYSTGLHEIGHSTGHPKRLNRDFGKGETDYAIEELRAEIATVFLMQNLGVAADESEFENNAAYINSWYRDIKENPDVLFTAIADADRIANYILEKEREMRIEPFAIERTEDDSGNPVYKLVMVMDYGQTRPPFPNAFESREELLTELDKMGSMPFWEGKEFKEVTLDELETISRERAEKNERNRNVRQEESSVYVLPSVAAAKAVGVAAAMDMTGRGIDSLIKMSDKDIVERAGKTHSGEIFKKLYNGKSVFNNEELDERALMRRFAMYTGDREQLLRLFKSSGQFRDEKPNAFYGKMADEAIRFISAQRNYGSTNSKISDAGKKRFGLNFKT